MAGSSARVGAVVLACWLAPGGGNSEDRSGPRAAGAGFRVRIARQALAAAVRSALEGATKRLAAPGCSAIFTDFADSDGRSLRSNLDALAPSAETYLALIGFYDGLAERQCLGRPTLAITMPGSRAVWVCDRFAVEQRRDPGLAEVILLHEALHSLGLGENPPSAAEITARVIARCGR